MQTIEERLDQLEKRRGLLTVGSIAMMVAIAIQLSACGKDPAGPSLTTCDASEIRATPLEGRNLTSCTNLGGANLPGGAILSEANLEGANLKNADLRGANLEGALNVPELSASQEEEACWSNCG